MEEIKTIVQIADIHIQKTKRHIEYRAIFDHLYDKMRMIKPDRIVICGDIYNSYNDISPESTNLMGEFFRNLSQLTKKLIIIPGNHDIVNKASNKMDSITPVINTLNLPNIVYYENSEVYIDENVAWVHYSIKDDYRIPLDLSIKNLKDKRKIGLFHGRIAGSVNDDGFKLSGVSINIFEDSDIVLCGDIHKRQELKTHNNVDVIYSGSLIQQHKGETISRHGYNVITLTPDGFECDAYDIDNPQKILHFVIENMDDLYNGNEKLVNV
jgi:DNA repair exonuclease SbcCD nuclease subunit